jgi:glycosyltransferase involved in cell wall biosynthesis
MDAQQAARAFYERDVLAAFVTGLSVNERKIARFLGTLPADMKQLAVKELRRRIVTEVPPELILSYPWLEGLRTVISRCVGNEIWTDIVWDLMSHSFDNAVARRHLNKIRMVYAFEYTARRTFQRAKDLGIARVLAIPSLDSREFEDIRNREQSLFPELRTKNHNYFAQRFAKRYERRRAEIALADVIIVNSEVTKRSHIKAGADPDKIFSVPLAAPLPIDRITRSRSDRALSVVWASNITIGKGAHYFINAWRELRAGDRARAQVYGVIGLPNRVLRPFPQGLELMGAVPREDLFVAFEQADVLVFPTLADGFGMIITEAFSRGLPVITTDKAGASDLVRHGRNGLIVPSADSRALAEALQWCLDNRDILYQMRFAALETARRWQWPDYRRKLIAEITKGLGRTGYSNLNFKPENNLRNASA